MRFTTMPPRTYALTREKPPGARSRLAGEGSLVRQLRLQRRAVGRQTAGAALVGRDRHHLEDLIRRHRIRQAREPPIAPRVDPAVSALEQQRIQALLQQLGYDV